MRKTLINWLGLLGVVSFISYTVAVIFSPLAYPGYDWKSQAVSDLSAANAPSLGLWNQLSVLYGVCGMICIMMVCVAVQGKLNRILRVGIYMFAVMNWVSYIGYSLFSLSESGYAGEFQDIMHGFVVTPVVVILSVLSLVLIMIGGYRKKRFVSLAVFATVALVLMFMGPFGINIAPKEYFGIFERFSVFAATGFNAILGIFLFAGKFNIEIKGKLK